VVAIRQADVLFQGIFVPPGAHKIELAYRPASYQIGFAVTIIGLLTWAVAGAYVFWPNIISPLRIGAQLL